MLLRVLEHRETCHVVMVRSAIKKIRRKSQREAARLQKKADAVKTMEEEEEIHFKRQEDLPDTQTAQIRKKGRPRTLRQSWK